MINLNICYMIRIKYSARSEFFFSRSWQTCWADSFFVLSAWEPVGTLVGMQQKAFQRQALQNYQPPVKREDSPYLHQSECGLWITESLCNMSHSRDMTAGSFAGDWRRLKEPSCWYPRVCGDTLTREGQAWLWDMPHTLLNSFQFYSILLFLSCGLFISCLLLSWGIPNWIPIDAFWVWRAGVSMGVYGLQNHPIPWASWETVWSRITNYKTFHNNFLSPMQYLQYHNTLQCCFSTTTVECSAFHMQQNYHSRSRKPQVPLLELWTWLHKWGCCCKSDIIYIYIIGSLGVASSECTLGLGPHK